MPASSVKIVEDMETAMAQANPDNQFYAAKVMGSARSSEGTILYYINEIYQ